VVSGTATATDTDTAHRLAGEVPDPEIPVLTIADLGVLRGVEAGPGGHIEVTITPTYSGCPAMDTIRADIVRALTAHGYRDVSVRIVLAPAWTTDWMTEAGKQKLAEYGIAPPGPASASRPGPSGATSPGPVFVELGTRPPVPCPQCGSPETRLLSQFSSTACKALYRCDACLEPFDHFKAL
jgi:ring-1,2-phenylacetyl-CoA epoxidase subunit PaaD